MCKNNCTVKEYRQQGEELNTLDVRGNYFLFDFYCPADSAIHQTFFFSIGSGSNCSVKLLKLTLSGCAKEHGAETKTTLTPLCNIKRRAFGDFRGQPHRKVKHIFYNVASLMAK